MAKYLFPVGHKPANSNDEIDFWSNVILSEGCWAWAGVIDSPKYGGYSRFFIGGRKVAAHRYSYELRYGPIPHGLHIDHLCRNRSCVNPEHMEAVTCRENILRGVSGSAINARKTRCVHGHALSPENVRRDKHGKRHCVTCEKERCSHV